MIEITIQTTSPNKVIKYLNKININIYNIKYKKDSITIKINTKDIDKLSKFYNYKIYKTYGISSLYKYITNNIIALTYLLTTILLIIMFTKITINIEVITENSSLRKHITNELLKQNITKYTLAKNNNKINKIKNIILTNNKDKLEWINIERIGMTYKINLEPKVEKNKQEESQYCNVISTKDSIVTKVITHKGVELIEPNESVTNGDILISGDITYNEETKKQVCASGEVYGTTWYEIHLSIPTTKETITKLDKKRYNIKIHYNNKIKRLLKTKYKDYITKSKKIINIFGLKIYIEKEIPIKRKQTKYTEEELNNLIKNKINKTLSHKLKGEYSIKRQNVLKKQLNNSKIELDIFIVAEELISTIESKDW